MASLAFALPLTPGKTEEWRQWSAEMLGPRRAEYEASRRRLGITVERAYLQRTPQGDWNIVYLEGPDIAKAFAGLAASQNPFDVWFRERAKDLFSGLDLSQPLPGPLAELVHDGGAS
jgi:hypothetical protein